MLQCGICKRKYKQTTNYNKHVNICSLVNSQTIKDLVAHDAIYSDNEPLETQVPSNAKMFAIVRHLASVVVQLQTKVANLEQLAYIRKPKPNIKDALATRAAKPEVAFRTWVMHRVIATITRATLTGCMAHQVSLIDAMCNILLHSQHHDQDHQAPQHHDQQDQQDQQPIYANNAKPGSFMIYDMNQDRNKHQLPDAPPKSEFGHTQSAESTGSADSDYEWQPLTPKIFQWMINTVHRQLLSEYHNWTVDSNDNSDEFIETSMRFGAIILGGTMEWSNFMAKLNSRLWTLMVEKQVSVFNE
jgi:Holliday junction resolvasome RuvABC endonuclease subunit